MFVYNIKINGSKVFKTLFVIITLIVIIIAIIVCCKIFFGAKKSGSSVDYVPQNHVSKISASNYTNILKTVHDDIDDYVGVKINFTGYVYRVLDFNENQFVLARDMIVSSNYQSVIVGFLCEADNAKDFADETWVDVTGEITKGDYHGPMPIVKVTEIKKADRPAEEYVYPPDDSYIPTAGIL